MGTQRTAAAGSRRVHHAHAGRIEHALGGAVDIGQHRGLHAAAQHQHLARMGTIRRPPRARGHLLPGPVSRVRRTGRHLVPERGRQQRPQRPPQAHGGRKQRRGERFPEQPAHGPLARRPLHPPVDDSAADIHEVTVLDAAWAGGLAIQAGQAAIQMSLGAARDLRAFEHLLDQINPSAWSVELIAQQLVGGAGGIAEAAMHAFTDDVLRRIAIRRVLELGTQQGLHLQILVQAAAIENALRIEGLFQSAVYAHGHSAHGREHSRRLVAAPNQRRMPPGRLRGCAHRGRIGAGAPPTLCTVPFDELAVRAIRAARREPARTAATAPRRGPGSMHRERRIHGCDRAGSATRPPPRHDPAPCRRAGRMPPQPRRPPPPAAGTAGRRARRWRRWAGVAMPSA